MPIELDILIDTPEYEVDMKSGLDTMQGISNATIIIGDTLLTGKVPERVTHKSNVRTTLKRTFKGSYGHRFRVDVQGEEAKAKLKKIGQITLIELVSYFMKEAIYKDGGELSKKAKKIVEDLGEVADELIHQLRKSAMEESHEVAVKFGFNTTIRHRVSSIDQKSIITFTQDSVESVKATRTDERLEIVAAIRRLNTNTGNGRLQLLGADETVAFGFRASYRDIDYVMKKKFSANLDKNNGIECESWEYLKIIANPIRRLDRIVVKYLVLGFQDV